MEDFFFLIFGEEEDDDRLLLPPVPVVVVVLEWLVAAAAAATSAALALFLAMRAMAASNCCRISGDEVAQDGSVFLLECSLWLPSCSGTSSDMVVRGFMWTFFVFLLPRLVKNDFFVFLVFFFFCVSGVDDDDSAAVEVLLVVVVVAEAADIGVAGADSGMSMVVVGTRSGTILV
jgi:hypothetical protein